jgi:hypothetical protein
MAIILKSQPEAGCGGFSRTSRAEGKKLFKSVDKFLSANFTRSRHNFLKKF